MDEITSPSVDESLAHWFSTYGLITVERTLSLIGFHLDQEELLKALRDESNIYHVFLQVPVKNILNGIIFNQAKDYREFAQKIFVDFLLSGAGNTPGPSEAEIQPGSAKDLLEQERLHLMELGEQYDLDEFEHHKLVAESQRQLISIAKPMQNRDLTEEDRLLLIETMLPYLERAKKLMEKLCDYRMQFYQLILRVRDLMETLPDYFPNEKKFKELRSLLHFDSNLGEERK